MLFAISRSHTNNEGHNVAPLVSIWSYCDFYIDVLECMFMESFVTIYFSTGISFDPGESHSPSGATSTSTDTLSEMQSLRSGGVIREIASLPATALPFLQTESPHAFSIGSNRPLRHVGNGGARDLISFQVMVSKYNLFHLKVSTSALIASE
jgi:hypothetical protein